MAKKDSTTSKKYLNILGIVTLVFGCLILVGAIVFMAVDFDLQSLGGDYYKELLAHANGDIKVAKMAIAMTIMSTGLSEILMGWLERRAAKNPEKSTFLLVLVVLSVISGVFTMVSGGFKDIANASGSIVSLTINVLALMAILDIRRKIDE